MFQQNQIQYYNRNRYALTIENEEYVSTTTPSGDYPHGKQITLTRVERDHYDFAGWSNDNVNTSVTFTMTGSVTIGPVYTPTTYNITYDLDGGSLETSNPTTYNIESSSITLNNPTKEYYDFVGWSGTGITGTSTSVTIPTGSTGARTYTAVFTPKKYTISYTLNDGSVSVANPTSYNIESSPITLNNPTRTNYDFTGWSGTGITGTSTSVTIPTGSHGDRSYTANWTESTPDDIFIYDMRQISKTIIEEIFKLKIDEHLVTKDMSYKIGKTLKSRKNKYKLLKFTVDSYQKIQLGYN